MISEREGSGERITIVNKELKAVGTIWGFVGAKRKCLWRAQLRAQYIGAHHPSATSLISLLVSPRSPPSQGCA